MRRIGVTVLGLASGLLAGLIVHDVLARVLLDDGAFPDSLPAALLVGFLTPALAVAGAVVALVVDSRRARRGSRGPRP
jgi:hypothetical protein